MTSIYFLPKPLLQWIIKTYIKPVDYLTLLLTAKLFHCLTEKDRSEMYYNNLVEIIKRARQLELFFDQYKYKIFKNHETLFNEVFNTLCLNKNVDDKSLLRMNDIFKKKNDFISRRFDKYSLCIKCLQFIINERFRGHKSRCQLDKSKYCQICYLAQQYSCSCKELKTVKIKCSICDHKCYRYQMWIHKHEGQVVSPTNYSRSIYHNGFWLCYERILKKLNDQIHL